MDTVIAGTRRQKRFAKIVAFWVGLVLVTVRPVWAQNNTPRLTDKTPGEVIRDNWSEETFKNLKAIHIFVCPIVDGVTLPDWLTPDAMVKSAREYIAGGHHGITYADGQAHDPDVRKCVYDPVLDEPGHLNFIIRVIAFQATTNGQTVPMAIVYRYIYRPDHRTSIYAFLDRMPLIVDLDAKNAKHNFESMNGYWITGFSNNPEYNK